MNPYKLREIYKYLTRAKKAQPDLPDVFPAIKAPIPPKTQNVEEIEAINRFIRSERQQKAGGGRIGYADGPPGKSAFKKPYAPEIEKRIIQLANQKNPLGAEAIAKKLREEFDGVFGRSSVGKRLSALRKEGVIKNIPVSERQASIDQRGEFFKKPAAEKYLAIREVRDIDKTTRFKDTGELKYNIPKNAKFKVDFKNPGVSGAKVSDIPEKFRGVQYYPTKKAAEKAVAERKKLKLKADVDPDTARKSANKKKYDLVKEVSDNNIERILADFKKGQPIEQAHRLSLNQVKKTGEMYNVMNLGLDFDDPEFVEINNKFVKPYENKLKQLYKEQNQLYKKASKLKNIPKELQKQIELNNKKISTVVDLSGGRVQGLQLDELTLKPKVTGVNYANVLGFGLYDKSVKELTDIDRAEIALIMEGQIQNEKKTAGKTAQKLFANTELLNNVDELAVKNLNKKEMFKQEQKIANLISSYSKLPECKVGAAEGGRIGFANSITCIQDGLKEQKIAAQNGNKKAARELVQVGKVATRAGLLKNILGPGAILGELVYEGALIGNKVLGGKPADIAYAESYLSYLDPKKYRGELDPLKMAREDMLTREVENADGNIKTINAPGFSALKSGFEAQDQLSAFNEAIEDRDIAKARNRIDQYLPAAADAREQGARADQSANIISSDSFKDASRVAQEYLQGQTGANMAKYRTDDFGRFESGRDKDLRRRRMQEMSDQMPRDFFTEKTSDLLNRTQYLRSLGYDVSTRGLMEQREAMKAEPLSVAARRYSPEQVYGTQGEFAGGGIAKIAGVSSGTAPVRGPNPQGLLSLKNRVRNY